MSRDRVGLSSLFMHLYSQCKLFNITLKGLEAILGDLDSLTWGIMVRVC